MGEFGVVLYINRLINTLLETCVRTATAPPSPYGKAHPQVAKEAAGRSN